MSAPLTAGYREGVLWQEQAGTPEVPAVALPRRADVVVVGGGYCGVAAAAELAARGREVVVVERDAFGWGASSRNGGMVIPELKAGPAALAARYGPLGPRLHREVDDAFDFVERLVADEGIHCHYARTGQLYLAHDEARVAAVRDLAREHAELGDEHARFLAGDELAAEIGSPAYPAGAVLGRTGALQPAMFHRALIERAASAGATLVGRTTASRVERRPNGTGFRLATTGGVVESEHLLLATNATADALVPRLQRRVLPIGSFIIATEPLEPALAASTLPTGRMAVDSKMLLFYWRLTPDGRMAFGGRRSLLPTTSAQARDFLHGAMSKVHPQLAHVPVHRVWGGEVAMTVDRLPHVGQVDGAWYVTGCNGSGVALNTWLGHRMAATIADGEPPPAFVELRHRPVPLHALRRLTLPVIGAAVRFHDRRFWR